MLWWRDGFYAAGKKKQSWDVKQGHLRQRSMPGQNMYNLALVYPLAFKLLQIYFPPIKFFMRQYWLLQFGPATAERSRGVQTWLSSSQSGAPNSPHRVRRNQRVRGRRRPPRPKVNHKALLFLHARQRLTSQRNTLWNYVNMDTRTHLLSAWELDYKIDMFVVAGQVWHRELSVCNVLHIIIKWRRQKFPSHAIHNFILNINTKELWVFFLPFPRLTGAKKQCAYF